MKKRILRVFLALTVFILLLSLPVRADEAELYQNSGADTLMEALPEEAQSLLQNVGANPMEAPAPDAVTKLFSALSEGFRAEWTAPARALLTLLVSCVLCRLVQEFAAKELSYAVSVCGALCAAVTLLSPMASLLEQAARVTDAAAVFLLAAVPVYAGLLFTAGNTVTAPTYGALSLAAANAVSVLSSAVLIPVLRVFLAFSVASAVTSFDLKRLTDALYKVIKWALVLAVTIYTGVLSVQTIVANSAEMAGGKAAKMLVSGAPHCGQRVFRCVFGHRFRRGACKKRRGCIWVACIARDFSAAVHKGCRVAFDLLLRGACGRGVGSKAACVVFKRLCCGAAAAHCGGMQCGCGGGGLGGRGALCARCLCVNCMRWCFRCAWCSSERR